MLDECMTFFFAGSQTTACVTTNLNLYLMQKPDILKKCRDEITKVLIEPYKAAHPGKEFTLSDTMDLDNIHDMKYYNMCLEETMRMETPVT